MLFEDTTPHLGIDGAVFPQEFTESANPGPKAKAKAKVVPKPKGGSPAESAEVRARKLQETWLADMGVHSASIQGFRSVCSGASMRIKEALFNNSSEKAQDHSFSPNQPLQLQALELSCVRGRMLEFCARPLVAGEHLGGHCPG